MKITRYFLIACSLASAVAAVLAARHTSKAINVDSVVVFFFYVLGVFLAVNGFYLLQNPPAGATSWRPIRMIRLWLDAKESELRKRAS